MKRLDEFSKEERIRFVLVKGLVLSKVIYEDIYLRQINDIDILVEEDDTLRMDYILRKMNYIQPYENIDNDQEPLKLLPYPIMRLKHTNHFFEYYNFRDEIVSKIELHKDCILSMTKISLTSFGTHKG